MDVARAKLPGRLPCLLRHRLPALLNWQVSSEDDCGDRHVSFFERDSEIVKPALGCVDPVHHYDRRRGIEIDETGLEHETEAAVSPLRNDHTVAGAGSAWLNFEGNVVERGKSVGQRGSLPGRREMSEFEMFCGDREAKLAAANGGIEAEQDRTLYVAITVIVTMPVNVIISPGDWSIQYHPTPSKAVRERTLFAT